MDEAKPFKIPKREVWEAFKRVKANQGAAGVDGQSIAEFEADLSNNLYKLWNRLSSGSYFPPPVRRVEIPKANGGTRPLGIPTVADRIAQEVARRYLEPRLGAGVPRQLLWLQARPICDRCRAPSPSALLALRLGARYRRQRVLRQHRLGADAQGGPSSYGLSVGAALHRALAEGAGADGGWQRRAANVGNAAGWGHQPHPGESVPALRVRHVDGEDFPHIPFERYADDVICHCKSAEEARALWGALADRFAVCKLVLHPQKTKIVYCKDANRRGDFPNHRSTFSGSSSEQGRRCG